MSSKLYNIKELNKDTILLKTKKLKTLCENEGNINKQHLNTLIEILEHFFEKYNDCFLSSVVWEVIDKIIMLENTIEEKKSIDVELYTSIKFCEFIFTKLIYFSNYENDNLAYLFGFNCLRRHLCSVISSFLNFNNSASRRKIETAFTNQLTNLVKSIFENIKSESDLELKVSYTELLWRSFRRIDLSTFNIKSLGINIETLERLKNFKILKFDEECINWLKEKNYIDKKNIIENGSFAINANKSIVNKDFILCYLGNCSIFLYYDNKEENEKCKIEIPYYHITSIHSKSKKSFTLDCKAIADHTNIFCLWSEDAKNSIDHETVNKLALSLKIKKTSKGTKELSTVIDNIILKLKKEENKNEKETFEWKKHKNNKKKYKKNDSESEEREAKKRFDRSEVSSSSSFADNNIRDALKDTSLLKIETYEHEVGKGKNNEGNYKSKNENKTILKKIQNRERMLTDYKLDLSTPQVNEKHQNDDDRDSDIEIMIEKIISCKKEKREKFKMDVKKKFSDALNDIDTNIKSLIEKQKCRRDELQKKYEKKKKNIIFNTEKEISVLSKEMNVLIENMKNINLNKNDVKKLYEEGKSIFYPSQVLDKSQALIQRIHEKLEKMNTNIVEKEKEYSKRKKLCFKALATAYE
ncbi:conserved Plasmodium protein, unknown function [Plasmodium vinckei vinckei]|uniref:Uncharacterized protein n=1 Tax=Plasmodium vinckei vinckei TaxID=54757 RepID=A0A449BUF3_PLAVN|nr:conserved Plasmodium protein, unknown function [Plasmodium vinckei vinckei]VEV56969.1 conserved Plasmodium protein, unknown function [Plasmodium vinckei vinckei]